MTIFKSLYCPFLAPTKVSLTVALAEREKTEVTTLTYFTCLGQRTFTKVKNNTGKVYSQPCTTNLDHGTGVPSMWRTVPATSMPQKDDRQRYKTALLPSIPYDCQHCEY